MLRTIMTRSTPKNVVVVGGSYVGVGLAEMLAKDSSDKFRVLLIEKNSHFQHLFAFPRFAVTTSIDTHKAFIPYQKSRLGQAGAIIQAKALSLSADSITLDREVELDGQTTNIIPFAALAITTGTKLSAPSTLPGSEKLDGTSYLRKHAARVEASNQIAIIGGGAVGVQTATDIKQLFPAKSVTLIHSRPQLMPVYHPGLHSIIMERLAELGVKTVLGRGRVTLPAEGYPSSGTFTVDIADGTRVPADMAIISTGQTPQSELLAALAPDCIDDARFIRVRPTLQVANARLPNVFALGDVAATKAHKAARPAQAQIAVVAANVRRLLDGGAEPLEEYVVRDPPAIHLTLGIERSVIFRNPTKDGREGSEAPVVMHKDDGRLDMGIEGMWARRGADITQSLL
ncbi:FAD/NAD-P-binding domain-containing protein [Boeremia exigua]|uniref:FAD/NAD-P-binding domain-containing protein n=1 Tax=Boeremia exigua TaxID=749465 RepID=UPI001E8DACE1|nr:FAD/NAD-P-binding domain-containing protein [Boeremia exigua]KAH6639392.1 FAD/NAD-P-binding domain-containing protein [Boeremia exigua]